MASRKKPVSRKEKWPHFEQRREESKRLIRALKKLGKILERSEASRMKWQQERERLAKALDAASNKRKPVSHSVFHSVSKKPVRMKKIPRQAVHPYKGTTLPDIMRPSFLERVRTKNMPTIPASRLPPFESVRHLLFPKTPQLLPCLPPVPNPRPKKAVPLTAPDSKIKPARNPLPKPLKRRVVISPASEKFSGIVLDALKPWRGPEKMDPEVREMKRNAVDAFRFSLMERLRDYEKVKKEPFSALHREPKEVHAKRLFAMAQQIQLLAKEIAALKQENDA